MPNLQLRLTPDDAELIARLCEGAGLPALCASDRKRAKQLAVYLRYRMSRLWGEARFGQQQAAARGPRDGSPVRSVTAAGGLK